ncbi:14-3-3 protein epsilon [Pseudolycoriella hygida]|uniref:14-3-3 protein epsilon n=1 Tax=Pseudolycoriella hygida TaxID=35572 RepID=A0A9Q0N8J7_9DIPT|nr:14-3-3 protein epsilon [Pseudolycoriella hygida]
MEGTFYEKSLAEYNAAFYISSSIFPPQNEIRLGLALKLSEGWHVMFNKVFLAYEIASAAYYDAFNEMAKLHANEFLCFTDREKVTLLNDYKSKLRNEIIDVLLEMIEFTHMYILPHATPANRICYFEWKSVCRRILGDLMTGTDKRKNHEKSLEDYKAAFEIAKIIYSAQHEIRLGLALKLSVGWHDMLSDVLKACKIARAAYYDAFNEMGAEEANKNFLMYSAAFGIAKTIFPPQHKIRLRLALKISEGLHDMLSDVFLAYRVARAAYYEAFNEMDLQKDLASSIMDLREMHVYEARIAQAADRPNAYESKAQALLKAWKRVSSFGENETDRKKVTLLNNYKSNLRNEIIAVLFEVIHFTDHHILPLVSVKANRVCYHKWNGNSYRFLGNLMTGTDKRTNHEKSIAEYNAAFGIAKTIFPPQHKIRLFLALKLSEGWHDMFSNVFKAYEIAKAAYYDAFNEMEMVEAVKKLHLLHENLTAEERNLFWIAYQSKVGALHTAIEKVNLIKNYKSNLRNEIIDVFFEMTEFTDEHILPYVSTQGSRYCYCKWKGDCYRFLGSVMTGTSKRIFYEKSLAEYTAAFNAIKIELPPQNEIRLGAALKISEGWHVMLNNVLKAYEVARVAYYDALNAYDCLEEANKNPLMVSLSKNLAKWQSEMQGNFVKIL